MSTQPASWQDVIAGTLRDLGISRDATAGLARRADVLRPVIDGLGPGATLGVVHGDSVEIRITHPAMRQELGLRQDDIVADLNRAQAAALPDAPVIRRLILRQGDAR